MKNEDEPMQLTLVPGDRAALERELLWNIALDGDLVRREQLCRMLTPAANTELSVAPASYRGQESQPE